MVSQSLTPLSNQGLRAFPPEVRSIIFNQALAHTWNGRQPNLIIALRGDPELYQEALEQFYPNNAFILRRSFNYQFHNMPEHVSGTIGVLAFYQDTFPDRLRARFHSQISLVDRVVSRIQARANGVRLFFFFEALVAVAGYLVISLVVAFVSFLFGLFSRLLLGW